MRTILAASVALLAGCAGPASMPPASEGAVPLLQQLIRIDTINPPQKGSGKANADETALCRYVADLLTREGIDAEIIESAPGRGNLIARIRGDDPSLKPLLLMAHVDVVNVDPDKWTHPPLSGAIVDGVIWGRGALDDKGPAAVAIEALRLAARKRVRRSRGLVLMLNADEESSGRFGAEWMVKNHWEKIDCAFALNEGGRIMGRPGSVRTFATQCAEKIYNDVRLWVRGESGHSSVPRADNAIAKLARALAKLEEWQPPVRIVPTVAAHLRRLAEAEEDTNFAALMRRAAEGDLEAAGHLARRTPHLNAILRSTVTPTLVGGGIRENVLPPDATVNLNIRLLPGEKLDPLLDAIAKQAGLPAPARIEVPKGADWRAELRTWMLAQEERRRKGQDGVYDAAIVVVERGIDAPDSPVDSPLFAAIEKAGRELSPEAAFAPMMSTGASDSRFLRARGVPAYGVLPLPATEDELKGFHDHNERVSVASVEYGVKLLTRIIEEVCR